ncbi:aminotransferase class III-fold pyridoxal phosphate-dependent enzyme [Aestuariivivens sediminis]|uniref:aminotransferase class III-fold pyridoxal phosphate-dependent enzyme n=1 Tax=Aestuariivivens sediminis TaxID=2913557 RepID=UPI001F574B1A|nr:aminotransferase class III-fold pyridoxal phosphate-dependent enzyme [Aestuariivivens sediminis]
MNFSSLNISSKQAEGILLRLYNLEGLAWPLPGEMDFNFKIQTLASNDYILKISRPNDTLKLLDFQQQLLQYIEATGSHLITPKVVQDIYGKSLSEITDAYGHRRHVRLLTWIPGRIWSDVNPQLDDLRFSLGKQFGLLTKTLQGFDHDMAHREFEWDVAQALWTKDHIALFKGEEKDILSSFLEQFEASQKPYALLRKAVVHNDANDNNVIVSEDLRKPTVKAAIDYGDSVYTQIINDLAIACAYAMMNHNDPLDAALPVVKGYHSAFPLLEEELDYLYITIAMRLVISVTKSAINKIKEPDNKYLLISEKPAWAVLKKWHLTSMAFATYSFRWACGYTAHPHEAKFTEWSKSNTFYLSDLFPSIGKNDIHSLDLSVSGKWVGHQEEFNDLALFEFKINQLQKKVPHKIIAGGYLEPRVLYTSSAYHKIGNSGKESRTIHLGIDFWLPHGTPVCALLDGEVVMAVNDAGDKEYGGLVVLKHARGTLIFYTLYGHLSVKSATRHNVGDLIKKGDIIGLLGNYPENGNWVPHLHFQMMLSLLDYKTDFPGVAYHRQMEVWKGICPNPNLLFKLRPLDQKNSVSNSELIRYRKQHLGKSLSLHYKVPVKMIRGSGPYLIDQYGKSYLDTVNNVAHVGHENYGVVKAGQDQMALINTNTRYLHEHINTLTKELLETLPPRLNVVHFVNSGSEANELAIRMVKAATGERDIIASEFGYHGNTNSCVAISSYKFDSKGGQGAPEHTHIFPIPDAFRGKYRGNNTASAYADEVQRQIDKVRKKGRGVGAFIIEPIISCGGQVELPKGFLNEAYKKIRAAGGLCISDEVQVGCGRVGKTFWGFQLHDVVPDIITIGKPLGNGHPLAAVVCTQDVANAFANGMEYFNTFGGNPVSCAIGAEVLRIVKQENLQENARLIGQFLKSELKTLAKTFPIIGEVRGQGLFLGIELVDSDLNPLPKQTDYLVNRMKDHGILMSSDGPSGNVIKIKPPMIFTKANAKDLIFYLSQILNEDFMKSGNID